MEEEVDSNGEIENGENEEKEIKEYKLPEYLDNLNPDQRQILLNLHIWASRERFLKKQRQAMRNFIASMKRNLLKRDLGFQKIYMLEDQIKKIQKMIDEVEKEAALNLGSVPVWNYFLANIRGLGEATAAGIVSQIGTIGRFHSISALRKYSGWYPKDGKAVRKEANVKGNYSPKMKQYLFHFCEGIIKAEDPVYYAQYLLFKKQILEKHPEYEGRKATKKKRIEGIPAHIHKLAKRKTIQIFLSDLFCIWRDLEGLPQTLPYIFAIGGHDIEHLRDALKNPHYKKPLEE